MRTFLIRNHFLIGSIFIILGVATWGYGHYVTATLENSLNANMTHEEKWIISGSLQWWKIAQITVLNPLSVVLICIGIIFIVYWIVQLALPTTIERRREQAIQAS